MNAHPHTDWQPALVYLFASQSLKFLRRKRGSELPLVRVALRPTCSELRSGSEPFPPLHPPRATTPPLSSSPPSLVFHRFPAPNPCPRQKAVLGVLCTISSRAKCLNSPIVSSFDRPSLLFSTILPQIYLYQNLYLDSIFFFFAFFPPPLPLESKQASQKTV